MEALFGILIAAGLAAATAMSSREFISRFARKGKPRSPDLTLDPSELEAVAQSLKTDLVERWAKTLGGTVPDPAPPPPAVIETLSIMKVYGKDLLEEADRIASRAGAERPSKTHVRQAADRIGVLRDRAGAATDLVLAVGSILVGAAASYQVNLWTGGVAAEGAGVWFAVAFAVGGGAIGAAGTLKWRRA